MLRTRLNKAYIKRTFRPLYGWTQMTPKSVFLDPNWDRSVDIYPGMVMSRVSGDVVTLAGASSFTASGPNTLNANDDIGYGLAGLYVGGDGIDEVLDSGINAYAVWVFGPDAEAEVLAPAFDVAAFAQFAETPGTQTYLGYGTTPANQGKLTPLTASGGARPAGAVLRLLKVVSNTKIVVGGLPG
jgi:hypothetical protein